ncbi:class I adenylate-forming enzyme family protein [Novosphingobium sp. JCM 18896]|uniref:class I adenylate-forming enzyme family protein n=1 Tax=Novosphingobium sp. JCM 18896 TaxID=2989731 RepID=UPI0022221AA8|nr:AMP-binding protein [Novosphingobium sp. JCM 18896]MCW1429691.1 AMP-binding protein [Novosphingobium sp. JCM 18896]
MGERQHIADRIDALAAQRGDDPALTVEDETWSYRALAQASRRAASRLHALGARPGDMVVLPMANSPEQVACFLGAWRLGATPLPLSQTVPEIELDHIMRAAGARIVLRAGQDLAGEPLWQAPSLTAARCRAQASGGSTGLPKVIVDTEPSTVDPAEDHWGWTEGPALFVPGPTYHSGPMNHLIGGLTRGVHVVMMRKFDAGQAIALIARHRPHWALFVPTMMNRLLKAAQSPADRAVLASLRRVWHSAAACPAWLKQAWIDLVGPDAVWEIFGGSEGVSTTIISGREWLDHPGSVGRAAGNGEIAVFDAAGQPVPPGTVGEIFMRNRVDPRRFVVISEVSQRLHGEWESFGDLGALDADGFLTLADRRIDMINSGGNNVFPAEVEAAIQSHPAVGDAVVFGQPDDDLGEVVCARVHVENGSLDRDGLLAHLATRLTRYKLPRRIEFTDEPIRNDAGKVRRSGLTLVSQAPA